MDFRTNGIFTLSYVKDSQEPKLFQMFLDVKTGVINHCSDGMNTGTLSTEALMNELKNAIVPNTYNTWLDDTGSVPSRMPIFEDMMYYLDLTKMCISTCMAVDGSIGIHMTRITNVNT